MSSNVSGPERPTTEDLALLRRALVLAEKGRFGAAPNPRVGCVLALNGEVVGEGFHRQDGGPHAEAMALEQAGVRARGAVAYVTLEPCSHHGRTPPCCRALIDAGVRRVVVSHLDPDDRVSGTGVEEMRAAGLEVSVGALASEAVEANLPYVFQQVQSRRTEGRRGLPPRPQVTLKWAMSLDGKIATSAGESQWISSPEGREWALSLREEHDAILVGSGTVLADDPRLTRRLGLNSKPHLRVILDRRLRTPPEARMFSETGPVVVYTCKEGNLAGAELVRLPSEGFLQAVMADLARRSVQSLLVEGGGEVAGAILEAGLYDRVAVCCSPKLIGGHTAPGPLGGAGLKALPQIPQLQSLKATPCGVDVVLTGVKEKCLQDLLKNLVE